jgi:predicted RNase H-like HicB family nuclease
MEGESCMMRSIYTMVFRQVKTVWIGVCLENGVVGQGATRQEAQTKLLEAIDSFVEAVVDDPAIYQAPIAINELHEFLTWDTAELPAAPYELQAIYA